MNFFPRLILFFCALFPMTAPAETTATRTWPAVPPWLVDRAAPAAVRDAVAAGRWKDAESMLAVTTSTAAVAERLRLKRLRREFSQSSDDILAKLRADSPAVTAAEVEAWRASGALMSLVIDGEPRFFRREPRNLLLSGAGPSKPRRAAAPVPAAADPSTSDTARFRLDDHIAEAFAAARDGATSFPLPVRFRVSHTATLKADAVPDGAMVRCWLPLAAEMRHQGGVSVVQTTPSGFAVSLPGAPMRTMHFRQPAVAGKPTVFAAEWAYTATAYVPDVDPARIADDGGPVAGVRAAAESADPAVAAAIAPQPPHVDSAASDIVELARRVAGDDPNPWRRARAIYEWIDTTIPWCAEMEYAVMPDIPRKVLAERRGDCGTQALLFVSLCRAAGVPARWQSGWVCRPGGGWNLHDWAEFHVAPYGWLPADPSAGYRTKADNPAVRTFFFGHLDAYRMTANTDYGRPFDPPMLHTRADPVDNQRGELEWDGGPLYYDVWNYSVEVTSEPGG